MATPPPPPPRPPSFSSRDEPPSPWRTILKIALFVVGGFALLVVVGVGLVAATCFGLAR
jgi:hypothetical protein